MAKRSNKIGFLFTQTIAKYIKIGFKSLVYKTVNLLKKIKTQLDHSEVTRTDIWVM